MNFVQILFYLLPGFSYYLCSYNNSDLMSILLNSAYKIISIGTTCENNSFVSLVSEFLYNIYDGTHCICGRSDIYSWQLRLQYLYLLMNRDRIFITILCLGYIVDKIRSCVSCEFRNSLSYGDMSSCRRITSSV